MVVLGLAVVVLVIALVSVMRSSGQTRERLENQIAEGAARVAAVERECASLKKQTQEFESEAVFLSRFLNDLPHLGRDLHSGTAVDQIPNVLLNILGQALEPEQAVVLLPLPRSPSESDPGRGAQLFVAGVRPDPGRVPTGVVVELGKGELGYVAEVQRTMSRSDLDQQPAVARQRMRTDNLPDFAPDVAAAMVFGDRLVGLLAVAGTRQRPAHAKAILRLVAQIGALALHDVKAFASLKGTANEDGLTRILNKRALNQALAEAIVKAQQEISAVSVFLFDIDNFKHYNDTNGHLAGDTLLKMLAGLVQENIRKGSLFGRFGGEEFLLLMPGVRREEALGAAERVRAAIAAHPFPFAERQPLKCLSVSGGVSEYPSDAQQSTGLLKIADEALYRAKQAGRNRVLTAVTQYIGIDPADLGPPAPMPPSPHDLLDNDIAEEGSAAEEDVLDELDAEE